MGHLQPDFSNETIVVTGASSGIGRATALDFAQVGATIINGDLRKNPKMGKRPTHELITENDGTAEYVKTDVSNIDDLRELVSRAREYGGVDVMVNNAAIATSGAFRKITSEQFNKIHQVNAHGVFFGTQAAANDMIDQKDPGVIINIASISSNLAQYDQTHYDSTKGAIRMITRGSALELSSHGVRVNAVAPG
jgi:NAD(P)-dependent dehydrogenase (short-subunit alcohol dehydrogenase family)